MTCDIIIPALNEASNIDPLFDAIDAIPDGVVRNVIIADNGSKDKTPKLAKARGAIVVHESKRGYGAACLKAIAWIEDQNDPPEMIAFLDADLSDDPAALPDLLAPIISGKAQIVLGSRTKLAEPGSLNLVQRFGSWLACLLISLLSGKRYTDLGPFRACSWSTFKQLKMADQTWGWTVELQMKAALMKIPIVEVDVPYRCRAFGKSKISGTVRGVVSAGAKIITTIFVIWFKRHKI